MKKFEIVKNRREISWKDRVQIKEGCTLEQQNQDPEIVRSFGDKSEALNELKSLKTSVCRLKGASGSYYLVEEFYVEENDYDEDGEWISGGDVLKFSEIPEF